MSMLSRIGARWALCLAVVAAGFAVADLTAAVPAHAAGGASFVQQASGHGSALSLPVTLWPVTTAGNRLVVEVGVWNSRSATTASVADNAGDTFVKLLSFTASDHTELSVWTAPVATGGVSPKV